MNYLDAHVATFAEGSVRPFSWRSTFMANSSRSNIIRFLAFTVLALVFVTTSKAEQLPPAAEEMAKAYGLDSWGQIEGIRYTWNAEFPGSVKPFDGGSGTIKVSRTWEWDPTTGTVSYEGKDNNGQPLKVTYQRSQLSSQSDVVVSWTGYKKAGPLLISTTSVHYEYQWYGT